MLYLRKIAEYLFYLFLFLLPWQTKLILRPAPTNFGSISLYASAVILLLALLFFFLSRQKKERALEIPTVWYVLAGWELVIFVSIFFAADRSLAVYHYLSFLFGLGLFFLLLTSQQKEDSREGNIFSRVKIIIAFLSGIFLQAVLGIIQFYQQKTWACKYLGLAAHDPSISGTAVVEAASGRWLRAYGGLDHPNILGGVLAVSLILVAYLLAKRKKLAAQRDYTSIVLFFFYFISLLALFFTFSRAAWLALSIGLLFMLLGLVREKEKIATRRLLAIIFFSFSFLIIVAYPYRSLLSTRFSDDSRLERKSIVERQSYIAQSWELIKDNPLFGVGAGNYTLALAKSEPNRISVWDYQPVHNSFLLLFAESGIFAMICAFGFFFLAIQKNRRQALAAAVIAALVILLLLDHWLFNFPFGWLFFFFSLGLIW